MKFAKYIAFPLLLLATVNLPVFAQDAYGKFTLAHESRWGSAVLPAGSYTLALRGGPVPLVIVSSGDRNAVSIMAVAEYMDTSQCKASSIELERNAGSWDVRSLCFKSSMTVHFNPPEKPNRTAAIAPQIAAIPGSN